MQSIEQEQQPGGPEKARPPVSTVVAMIFGLVALCCFIASLTIYILNSLNLLKLPSPNNLTAFFNTLGAVLGFLSMSSATLRNFFRWASSRFHLETNRPSTASTASYNIISSLPPPIEPKAILQREEIVKQIYEMLTLPEVTAIVLTGIAGIGKSTLAALVYSYNEKHRYRNWRSFFKDRGPFTAESLWLKVDSTMKMIDIAGTLFKYLGRPMPPNFVNLPPQGQALELTQLLKITKNPRLIILDQFDKLFDIHSDDALFEHPEIGEWLNALNSQPSKCKILFTSCSWLQGARVQPRTHMKEFHVRGVSVTEAKELLRKHELKSTDAEVRTIIERCDGHMLALTELINLLQRYQLTLTAFLKSDSYFQLWRRKIALDLLRDLYTRQLDTPERKLLSAFGTYSIPVPLDAAEVLLNSKPSKFEVLAALDVLLTQHLLRPSGGGNYDLHPIVAHYIRNDLEDNDEQSIYRPSQKTHSQAAQYCLQRAKEIYPPRGQRKNTHDVCFLIEALRQLCQCEQQQKAYEVLCDENIPDELRSWGENAVLLEIYQLLLPLDKWHPNDAQTADIYSNLGELQLEMTKRESNGANTNEALQYFKRSWILYNQMEDDNRKCSMLLNIGMLYLKQNQNEVALAFILQAEKLLGESQSALGKDVAACKEKLSRQVGKEHYETLFHKVELRIEQIVNEILD